jgi:NADH:ubiquinone oxidoreductase subunit 5 (subunit L)/multisubunit Na+/H+ antiporter MnhA subunit
VGLLSFLLVSFWYSKVNTFKSGIKVLLYNRIGDFFLFISIGLLEFFLKVDGFSNTSYLMPLLSNNSINFGSYILLEFILGFSLMAVILSKSAQFGFHIWLLEAMEAPLPASSLIHSATLVCAGVVLFFKSFNFILYSSYITSFIIFWSSLTACFLSASALLNYDIKKILAYSTGSHVSLMLILSISSGGSLGYAYTLVHASIKVFIFLLFGFIIDVNQGIRDIRKMGGFFRFQDITYYGFFAICSLSSLPFFPLAF